MLIWHQLLTQTTLKCSRLEAFWQKKENRKFHTTSSSILYFTSTKYKYGEGNHKFHAFHLKEAANSNSYPHYSQFHKGLYVKMIRSVVNICYINPLYLHFAISRRIGSLYMQRREMALWPLLSPLRVLLSAPSYQSSFHFVSWQQTSQTLLLVLWPLTPH